MTELTNFLTDLADKVHSTHQAFVVATRVGAEKAIELGTMLNDAKTNCDHGSWLPFLKRSGVPERWAQRFMQISRSGLNSDTVADLGIKGTLEYLAKRKLPLVGDILTVGKQGWTEAEERTPLIIISCSKKNAGYFDCAQIVLSESVIEELPSVAAKGALAFIEMHRVPPSEREFITMPEGLILPTVDIREDALPETYTTAIRLLRECVIDFSPERYHGALKAVRVCEARSHAWPISSKLLDTYFAIAKDDEMMKLCSTVQKMAKSYEGGAQ